ncbi:hypothetical protein NYA22BAC_00884 [Parasphingorhabdus sp. NYA22]
MVMHMGAWVASYFILSLFITALYVRQAKRSKWTKFLRKHFYFFPIVPIIVPFMTISRLILAINGVVFRSMRWIFEKLSGKKTYRRRYGYFRQ